MSVSLVSTVTLPRLADPERRLLASLYSSLRNVFPALIRMLVASTVAPEQGAQAVRQAGQLRPLTEQTVLEQQTGTALTGEELVAGIAGLTPTDKTKKILESRVSQFQGQGGAVQSQQGVIGLGGSQKQ